MEEGTGRSAEKSRLARALLHQRTTKSRRSARL